MDKAEAIQMVESQEFQRKYIENFDELIELCNWVRSECRVDGDRDHLVPGKRGDASQCPIALTLMEDTWPGDVEVEPDIQMSIVVLKEDPKWWGVYEDIIKEALTGEDADGYLDKYVKHPTQPHWNYQLEAQVGEDAADLTWRFGSYGIVALFVEDFDAEDTDEYAWLNIGRWDEIDQIVADLVL